MTPDVSGFYRVLGVNLPTNASQREWIPVSCITNPGGHKYGDRNKSAAIHCVSGVHCCQVHGSTSPYDVAMSIIGDKRRVTELLVGHGLRDGHSEGTRNRCRTDSGERAEESVSHLDVDGIGLIEDVRGFITRYVALPSEQCADLLALWVLHTWAIDASFATPYLRITSATPDSGKTLLLEVLAALCRQAWHAVNPSTAVLYRKIDAHAPTLLLDEMDNYPVEDRRDALAVLNGGYKRGATVDRCKENGDLQQFKAYCPKAYAGLDQRSTVSTLLSRSVTIRLKRKTAAQQLDMWIAPLSEPDAEPLRAACAAWAQQHMASLGNARPMLPPWLVNRAAEVWWALLAIADEIGGNWPGRVRVTSKDLGTGGDQHDAAPDLVTLLADIRDAFGEGQTIFSEALLCKLNAIEEHPWGARRRGEGLDARGLSNLLRPLGIKPRTIGSGKDSAKGYRFDQFTDAFERHLSGPSRTSHPSHPNADGTRHATVATDATDIPESIATTREPGSTVRESALNGATSEARLRRAATVPSIGDNGRPVDADLQRMVGELSDHELLDACPGSSLIREGELEGAGPVHECSDPAHRALGREWTARDGRHICGECHPPAHPSLVARRAA